MPIPQKYFTLEDKLAGRKLCQLNWYATNKDRIKAEYVSTYTPEQGLINAARRRAKRNIEKEQIRLAKEAKIAAIDETLEDVVF